MANQATYDDANLILRLYELRREEKMREARDWFMKNYRANSIEEAMQIIPMGSQPNAYFRMVVSYWEMAASFITSGVLNKELFFESNGELLFVWLRVEPIVAGFRGFMKNPEAWKNLETVAKAYIEHMKAKGPEAFESMKAMVNMPPQAARTA
jgi:hypothetical protein